MVYDHKTDTYLTDYLQFIDSPVKSMRAGNPREDSHDRNNAFQALNFQNRADSIALFTTIRKSN